MTSYRRNRQETATQRSLGSFFPSIGRRSVNGSVLLVVVVLLLLASLFVLFGLDVGRFEQKTSGNDVRAKVVQELAEAGMHQGVEYFNANRPFIKDDSKWEACTSSDAFPCGAVPAARRTTMLRFKGGNGTGGLLVPIPNAINIVGGYAATQQVGAVLCRIKKSLVPGAPTTCTGDQSLATSTWLITVVSKGNLTSENSSATVTQTMGAYSVFSLGPNIPPVIASGPVVFGANSTVVTAANAAGNGVPTSVWTRAAFNGNGNPNTCQMDAFQRTGSPQYLDGITQCTNCSCPNGDSLSHGQGSTYCMGMDIVKIDSFASIACTVGGVTYTSNADIKRAEFPPDLFAYIFGQPSWSISNPGNNPVNGSGGDTFANKGFNFGDTRIKAICTYPDPATGAPVTTAIPIPQDTCYLLNLKNIVHIGDGVNDAAECTAIGPGSRGIIWIHDQALAGVLPAPSGCNPTQKSQIGTPSHPVAMVYDGTPPNWHVDNFYGLLFLREPNASNTISPIDGGSVVFHINGGSTFYGGIVVQGQVDSQGGGGSTIVYNDTVLRNLINDPLNETPSSVPGSWTDKMRY